jgi:hypothetical protein
VCCRVRSSTTLNCRNSTGGADGTSAINAIAHAAEGLYAQTAIRLWT